MHRIGTFIFAVLQGQVPIPATRLEKLVRPGIDGAGYLDVGKLPVTFQIRSIVDPTDYVAAVLELEEYQATVDQGALTLVKDNIDYSANTIPFKVKVLAVNPVECRAVPHVEGGLNPGSRAVLVCEWTLEAVETGA